MQRKAAWLPDATELPIETDTHSPSHPRQERALHASKVCNRHNLALAVPIFQLSISHTICDTNTATATARTQKREFTASFRILNQQENMRQKCRSRKEQQQHREPSFCSLRVVRHLFCTMFGRTARVLARVTHASAAASHSRHDIARVAAARWKDLVLVLELVSPTGDKKRKCPVMHARYPNSLATRPGRLEIFTPGRSKRVVYRLPSMC